jgi:pimeloyl-ACP methyl ester carboxylesterase
MDGKIQLQKAMNTKYYCYKNFQLHYRQYGEGDHVWLTFHGFGQTHAAFGAIAEVLSKRSTVYSFDLLFHGESSYNLKKPIKKEDWVETVNRFLNANDIKRFSLAGFSIGCRLMYPIIVAFPGKIDKVVLLAPDGIGNSFWYRLATKPFLRDFLKYSVLKPGIFFKISDVFKKYSITDKSLVSFARNQMKERKQRWRVYKTWVFFRKLRVKRELLARVINENQISVIVFLANQDRIIVQKPLQPFIDQLKNCTVIIMDTVHHKLIEKSAEIIGLYSEKA